MKYLTLIILAIVALAFVAGCTSKAPVVPAQQTTPTQAAAASDQQVVADASSQVDSSLINSSDSVDIGAMI